MASASTSQPQQINVADLDIAQLGEVRTQLEEELNHLTNSFAQLKQAQTKFKACIDNVGEINPNNIGRTILVPLTNSLYVPGKLSDFEHVIVDVGTGYYVKKTRSQAKKYYETKVDFIRGNLESLQETISKKQDNLNYVLNIIQVKLQAEAQSAAKKS
ncbi:Prefoldin-domain-containing protein [Neolentinus lepideus HHB14362 ss-1]|uniref:Prefoldin-domain-containing protein n=1 Tax=Neolentinus lepideus HHB14362 ss-1 TaxID=1314782 RepID=A0A165VSZ9_9AGAM|nr:Prefoldin-domain-containing protein [Neolentinus lepideus HHB14362 ss-1]